MPDLIAAPEAQIIMPTKFGPGLSAKKIIAVPLSKEMHDTEEGLLVIGKFTSDNKDEVGDIITRSATERAIPSYRQWGNIRYMHQPRPVGRVTRIGTEDGLEWNEVEFLVIDPQAKFEVQNGLLKALSIGAMIMWDDIDFLEDGGWIINDYSLAEISLVDHPANYDAKLDLGEKQMTNEGRMLVRANGLDAIVRQAPHMLTVESEENMSEPTAEAVDKGLAEELAEVIEEVEEPVEEIAETEEAPVEEPVAEEEAEEPAEETAEVQASIDTDEPVEEPAEVERAIELDVEEGIEEGDGVEDEEIVEEEEEVPAEEPAEEPVEEPVEVEASVDTEDVLAKALDVLAKSVENQTKLIEVLVQRGTANAQPAVDGEGETEEDGEGREVREPVERASVPETDIPDEDDVEEIERTQESDPADLRSAIRMRYLPSD